ncbi:MAG TPA: transporter substrate-binding domain-containing protein [bacterium]
MIFAMAASSAQAQSDATRRVAPTGKLRVNLIGSNAILIAKGADGRYQGIAVLVGERLAKQLGVPLAMEPSASPAAYAESLSKDTWDIVLSGRDPLRAEHVVFSEPYLEIESLFLARPGVDVANAEQVDRAGLRIVVAKGGSQDNYLTRTLKHATLIRAADASAAAKEELPSGRADVFGGTGPGAYAMAAGYPGAKILAGRFSVVEQSIGLPRKHADALPVINAFVADLKRSGVVAAELQRMGMQGVRAAP